MGPEEKELFIEVSIKAKEKFKGRAYTRIMGGINLENATGSQYFFNSFLNSILPKSQRVIFLEDIERINNKDEIFLKDFYTDTPEIILRSETPYWECNKYILEDLVKQINGSSFKGAKYEFSPENPLRISGLELIEDENQENFYCIKLKIGKDTKIINDKRFSYSNNIKIIPFGEKTKKICTKENGLSWVRLNWGSDLYSGYDKLSHSDDSGRIVIRHSE